MQGQHFLPFGEEMPVEAGMNTRKFTGHERDAETGLDYMVARYYGAQLGRFMSPDPDSESVDLAFPQTWNAYSYVLNNPLRAVDPDGLDAEDRVAAAQMYTDQPPIPYVWGGKASNFDRKGGLDCSGFTQIIFNIEDPDAHEVREGAALQYEDFQENGLLSDSPKAGDLVFFQNTNGNVKHVGIVTEVGADGAITVVHQRGNSNDTNPAASLLKGHETTTSKLTKNKNGKYNDLGPGLSVKKFGRPNEGRKVTPSKGRGGKGKHGKGTITPQPCDCLRGCPGGTGRWGPFK